MPKLRESIASLGQVLENGAQPKSPNEKGANHLVDRLIRKFGSGAKPQLRSALYERLSREVDLGGEDVMRIISECVLASESATYKDRYFCAAVTRRLREAGFLKGSQKVQW